MSHDQHDMPERIWALPRNKAGYPVPWFVATVDGEPDFRVIRPGGVQLALYNRLCWVCGTPLIPSEGVTYVIGSMCAVNRVSSEPPSHRACAVYAAQRCPFLANPHMRRRTTTLPDGRVSPAGQMLERNPGVALVWRTDRIVVMSVDNGVLFNVGEPLEVLWFAEGRQASRSEVLASIGSGLPLLEAEARKEGKAALAHLARLHEQALTYLPT